MAKTQSADLLKKLAESESAEQDDLLSGLDDTADAEAWVPEDAGEGIQGTVVDSTDDMPDQFKDDETVPVVTIETAEGEHYRIIGYSTTLRKEIRRTAPRPGDLFAVKYFGQRAKKTGKFAGKPVHIYKAALRRNPRTSEDAPF